MLNLKKTAVAVLAFSSSAVFAGTMGPVCAPGNVTVPCEATAWDFGAQALYLEQSYDGNDWFGLVDEINDGRITRFHENRGHRRDHNDRWNWGFQIEGSYHFNTGNDVNLNWYHLSRSRNRFNTNQFVDVDGTVYNFVEDNRFHHNRHRTQWDAVNFEFGQHVDFSQWTKIRFHEGAQYARIQAPSVPGVLFNNNNTFTVFSNAQTYNGFGPRAGADMYYDVGNGFALYGKAATALLAGTNKFSNRFGTFTNRSKTVIVPELEAKLGAKYTYAMASGDLTLDVGYMWVDYLNARVATAGNSDFGLNGVYFGAKWVGNVA